MITSEPQYGGGRVQPKKRRGGLLSQALAYRGPFELTCTNQEREAVEVGRGRLGY